MYYMKRLNTIVVAFLAFGMLCGGVGFLGYVYGQDRGYDAGYGAGQGAGYSQGYDRGRTEGYEVGYGVGYESEMREASRGYNVRNPTYKEMREFLSQDTTDSRTYVVDKYNCSDFSAEINNNAESQGIRCAVVDIFHPGGYGHAIVAFETVDKGLIFIEPQFDHEVSLIVGESYSDVNNYTSSANDDTIKRFLVIW